MKLTPRLKLISSLVSEGAVIADIGTDHGYIPVYLLNKGIIKFAYLSDINKGPLENARNEIIRNSLEKNTELRLGPGLEVYNLEDMDKINELIIAGMGGILISEIITKSKEVSKLAYKMILQPMQAPESLREYLLNNGFSVLDEHLEKEDMRIYEIIETRYTGEYDANEKYIDLISNILKIDRKIILDKYMAYVYEVSPLLVQKKHPLIDLFITKKIDESLLILEKISINKNDNTSRREEEINNRLEYFNLLKQKLYEV